MEKPGYNLIIRVEVQSENPMHGRLTLVDEFRVSATDFMEMCRILGQFDDLAARVRADKRDGR